MSSEIKSLGPYTLVKILGRGGMGVVYHAQHRDTGDYVALKTILVSQVELLQGIRREIRTLVRLQHPGIVRILDQGIHADIPWYSMELLEGKTLGQYFQILRSDFEPSNEATQGCVNQVKTGSTELYQPVTATNQWWTRSLVLTDTGVAGNETVLDWAESPSNSFFSPSGRAADATTLPTEYTQHALTIIRRLCATLAYLHGEGVIHCDLKPDNIFIKSDGMPVLVDFGLMASFSGGLSREALSIDIGGSGTVKYMAPEQIQGELLDARVDLYALGCIIYEIITGQPPFIGDKASTILQAHLWEPVKPVSTGITNLPPELHNLVDHLLQKDPSQRLGYASDVARILTSLGADNGLSTSGRTGQTFLFRSRLAGRSTQLKSMRQKLASLKKSQGGMILIGGESGVGKTRFVMEIGKIAALAKMAVLTGECKDISGHSLQAFRKILIGLADYCRDRGPTETDRIFGRRGKVLATYEQGLRSLPGLEKYPEPEPLPAEAARLRLYSCLHETLERFGQEKEMVILIDDLQWADELSLGFLNYLAQNVRLQNKALLLFGTYRTEDMTKELGQFVDSPGIDCLVLERLELDAVSNMIGDMLSLDTTPPYFSNYLSKHSEGNPFFIAEYLHAAVEKGLLVRDEKGNWQISRTNTDLNDETNLELLPLPHSLRELVDQRLESLSVAAATITQIAAVIGRETTVEVLLEITRFKENDLFDALQELTKRHVFDKADPHLIRFGHDKIREVAYSGIEPKQRKTYHLKVAGTLEKVYSDQLEDHYSELGFHYQATGRKIKARQYYLLGAQKAAGQYAYVEAERLYRAYFNLVDEPTSESIAARSEFGQEVLLLQSKHDELIGQHQLGIQEARSVADRLGEATHNLDLGISYFRIGEVAKSADHYEQALVIARSLGDKRLEGSILGNYAGLYLEQNDLDKALSLYEQALPLQRQTGDLYQEGKTLSNLAILYNEHRQIDKVPELYEQALAIHREIGNRRSEGITLYNLAAYNHELGRLDQAQAFYEQSWSIAHEIGNQRTEGMIMGNLAELYARKGYHDQAQEFNERALELHRKVGNRRGEAITLSNMGDLAIEMGHPEKGQQYHEQALSLSREVNDRWGERHSLGELANLLKNQGLLAEAMKLFEKSYALALEIGDERGQGRVLGDLASVLFEQGQINQAVQKYKEARHIAQKTKDFEFEAIFLTILASFERRLQGQFSQAEQMIQHAFKILEDHQFTFNLGTTLCEWGHIALAQGQSAQSYLDQANAFAEQIDAKPEHKLYQQIRTLKQAEYAFQQGRKEALFRGELISIIPPQIREWYFTNGLLKGTQ